MPVTHCPSTKWTSNRKSQSAPPRTSTHVVAPRYHLRPARNHSRHPEVHKRQHNGGLPRLCHQPPHAPLHWLDGLPPVPRATALRKKVDPFTPIEFGEGALHPLRINKAVSFLPGQAWACSKAAYPRFLKSALRTFERSKILQCALLPTLVPAASMPPTI